MKNLELFFESGESTLEVRRFVVHEAISHPFEVAIIARSPNEDIDLESIVGKQAGFILRTGAVAGPGSPKRVWSGVCRHMELLQVEPTGLSSYYLRIVPTLWLLRQRVNCRIFQHESIPEVVGRVLGEWNIKPLLQLGREHPPLEYVVQWRESDFAFVSRLLEQEGISYSFTFHDDKPVDLVLADQPEGAWPRPPVPFVDDPGEIHADEHVHNVHLVHEVRPGKVALRDFDFRTKPDYPLFGRSTSAAAPEDFYEHYCYEPGAFRVEGGSGGGTPVADDQGVARHDDKRGEELAGRRLAAVRRGKRTVIWEGNVVGLAPGVVFSIDHHPRQDLDAGKTLLVTNATFEGTRDGEWTFTGEAHFTEEPFAPLHLTPRPRISGVQVATVVGPPGEEIYCDEFGRVRVQFPWDRDGKLDHKSSCWMRVSQAWAGAGFGCVHIPRVGQEVLVAFYGGDPDQPVIVGRNYNTTQPVPYPLPAHKTKSTWKSDSSPKVEGYNEIRLDDAQAKELVYVQAQRNLQKLVKHDETERTGQNRFVVVGKNRNAIIAGSDTTLVGERWQLQVVEPLTPEDTRILQQASPKLVPTPTKVEMIDERVMSTTGKAQVLLHGKTALLQCKGGLNIKAGGNLTIEGGPYVRIN